MRERSYEVPDDLRVAWDEEAERWAAWARSPEHDSYWRFHRDSFLQLLPSPAGLTIDVGCGEGRLDRDLRARGYRVIGLDGSPKLARLASEADPLIPVMNGDAARLPVRGDTVDLFIAFMSLQDVDDLDGAVGEAARVLRAGGRLCLAIVHPMNSAGQFVSLDPDAAFVVEHSYFTPRRYVDHIERNGLRCTFSSDHRTIETFSRALEGAGFFVEAIREVTDPTPGDQWNRIPMFLQIRAVLR